MKFRSGKGKGMFIRQYARQGGVCPICGKGFPMEEFTRDHIVPRGKFGSPEWTNIRLLCQPCHILRHKEDGNV